MKKITLLLAIFFAYNLTAQTTSIPDINFEQFLVDEGIDSDATVNGQVLTSDIADVIELDITGSGVDDLTGLEDFSSLEYLNIEEMLLTSIDLSGNPNLKELFASFNQLTVLDVSNNPQLELLGVSSNLLQSIDVSNNPLLTGIDVGNDMHDVVPHNQIEELDLSNNPLISYVIALNMGIMSINHNNGNNHPDTHIITGWDTGETPTVCVNVDNIPAAQNGDAPYDSWELIGNYSFGDSCDMSTEDFSAENFSLYPNPVQDICYIQTKEPMAYELFTVSGAMIKSGAIEVGENELKLEHLSQGIYFLKLKNDEGATKTIKVLKE